MRSRLFRLLKGAVRLHPDLVEGRFIARLNRFAALVKVAGREVTAHVVNTWGQRHVREMGEATHRGWRSAVVFVVQRGDVTSFAANDTADPAFGQALREAARIGAEVYAYRCRVTPHEVTLSDRLPVPLDSLPEALLR